MMMSSSARSARWRCGRQGDVGNGEGDRATDPHRKDAARASDQSRGHRGAAWTAVGVQEVSKSASRSSSISMLTASPVRRTAAGRKALSRRDQIAPTGALNARGHRTPSRTHRAARGREGITWQAAPAQTPEGPCRGPAGGTVHSAQPSLRGSPAPSAAARRRMRMLGPLSIVASPAAGLPCGSDDTWVCRRCPSGSSTLHAGADCADPAHRSSFGPCNQCAGWQWSLGRRFHCLRPDGVHLRAWRNLRWQFQPSRLCGFGHLEGHGRPWPTRQRKHGP